MLAAGAKPGRPSCRACGSTASIILCHMLSGVLAAIAGADGGRRATARRFRPWPGSWGRTGCCRPSSAPVLGGTLLAGGARVGGRHAARRHPRDDADQRPAAPADRRVLGAGLPRRAPAGGRADRQGRAARSWPVGGWSDGRRCVATPATDWFGPARGHAASPSSSSARSTRPSSRRSTSRSCCSAIAVNTLIAFSQMIIIAIGQMNLSVGAIGGLAAICFAGD